MKWSQSTKQRVRCARCTTHSDLCNPPSWDSVGPPPPRPRGSSFLDRSPSALPSARTGYRRFAAIVNLEFIGQSMALCPTCPHQWHASADRKTWVQQRSDFVVSVGWSLARCTLMHSLTPGLLTHHQALTHPLILSFGQANPSHILILSGWRFRLPPSLVEQLTIIACGGHILSTLA